MSEDTENLDNMKKWFKKMYYDKAYADTIQDTTDGYAAFLKKSPDWGTEYTGKQEIGNHKMTTIEDLEKQLELAKQLKLMEAGGEEEEKDIEKGQKGNDAGNVPQSPAVPTTGPNAKA